METGRIVPLVGSVLLASSLVGGEAGARQRYTEVSPSGSVPLASLPSEAQATYRLIFAGGPFPYAKDGIVFGNRERSLPREPRGYYHEYTVRTPGARDRGARRVVCGGLAPAHPPSRPDICYYTGDHYATFQPIAR